MSYPVSPNQTQKDLLEIDIKFIEDEISLDEFIKEHKYSSKEYWKEVPFLANNMVYLNRFLIKLPVPLRLQAAMALNQLTFDDLKDMGFGGSINKFFQYNPKNQLKPTLRYFELAPFLDIPIEYMNRQREFQNVSFDEYELKNSASISIADAFKVAKEKPNSRQIGAKIVQNHFLKGKIFEDEPEQLFLRIDRRQRFYSLEFFIRSHNIKLGTIEELTKTFLGKDNSHIYICDAFLRDHKKLIFLGAYEFNVKALENYVDYLKDRFRSQKVIPYRG
ncbi:hypothetical protein RJD24_12120 [Bacillaceae bacterium IKA-2]|nr:hypothetical protein RJD24_12120 [Bacillaceae bacterium IKA-2]